MNEQEAHHLVRRVRGKGFMQAGDCHIARMGFASGLARAMLIAREELGDTPDCARLRSRLLAEVNADSDKRRRAVALRAAGMKIAEIAHALHMSPGWVSQVVSEARGA